MDVNQTPYLLTVDETSHCASTSSTFGLVDLSLYRKLLNKIQSLFRTILFFFLCQLSYFNNSKVRGDTQVSDSEASHRESLCHGSRDDGKLERDEVKMVMEKLGFSCSPESDELEERYGSSEISGMFEEEEPSLEELKQAFDVFDENRDGFIDARELQRILCKLGLKEAKELKNCQKMITNFDENGDERIDFHEFVKLMENTFLSESSS